MEIWGREGGNAPEAARSLCSANPKEMKERPSELGFRHVIGKNTGYP